MDSTSQANKPGAAARARALEVKQRAPVRVFAPACSARHNYGAWRTSAPTARRRWRVAWTASPTVGACSMQYLGEKGSDIDHVIIGPGGVFTLNTKNHTGGNV